MPTLIAIYNSDDLEYIKGSAAVNKHKMPCIARTHQMQFVLMTQIPRRCPLLLRSHWRTSRTNYTCMYNKNLQLADRGLQVHIIRNLALYKHIITDAATRLASTTIWCRCVHVCMCALCTRVHACVALREKCSLTVYCSKMHIIYSSTYQKRSSTSIRMRFSQTAFRTTFSRVCTHCCWGAVTHCNECRCVRSTCVCVCVENALPT